MLNQYQGSLSASLAIVLYTLLNWSYTVAVFTDPGSTMKTSSCYTALPSSEPHDQSSLTVKSTGEMRYCKKCQIQKPDRAHHCSTCRRCVLKMDHHCPWLAACVGLRNYKPFLLFLVYTCLFCWLSFAASSTWVWYEILSGTEFEERLMPVNYILLAVLGGIIGLVLTGFTGWHVYLASRGQTTIENLEKIRYVSPIRKSLYPGDSRPDDSHSFSDQLRSIHANAIPGVTRPEEGEERLSPNHRTSRRTYRDMEAEREHQRWANYLDEQDSEKLPNAFDLGWRRNLTQVFGNRWFYRWLPICNSAGDGWAWETSTEWAEALAQVARHRTNRAREQAPLASARMTSRAYGRTDQAETAYPHPTLDQVPLQPVTSKNSPASSEAQRPRLEHQTPMRYQDKSTNNWNDVPETFFTSTRDFSTVNGARTRSPRPG